MVKAHCAWIFTNISSAPHHKTFHIYQSRKSERVFDLHKYATATHCDKHISWLCHYYYSLAFHFIVCDENKSFMRQKINNQDPVHGSGWFQFRTTTLLTENWKIKSILFCSSHPHCRWSVWIDLLKHDTFGTHASGALCSRFDVSLNVFLIGVPCLWQKSLLY